MGNHAVPTLIVQNEHRLGCRLVRVSGVECVGWGRGDVSTLIVCAPAVGPDWPRRWQRQWYNLVLWPKPAGGTPSAVGPTDPDAGSASDDLSKVVMARRTTLATSGALNALWVLEALQVCFVLP